MAIIFHCEYCGKKIEAADSAGGKRGKCPSCHNKLYVPNLNSDDEELKLAPIDTLAEEREKQLMAETYKLTRDILQEREVPLGPTETTEQNEKKKPADDLGYISRISEKELTKYVVTYLKQMAKGELNEAQKTEVLIVPHSARAVEILDRIALSEIPEPELTDVPPHVLSGLIRSLREEIS